MNVFILFQNTYMRKGSEKSMTMYWADVFSSLKSAKAAMVKDFNKTVDNGAVGEISPDEMSGEISPDEMSAVSNQGDMLTFDWRIERRRVQN